MYLKKIQLSNFCCFENLEVDNLGRLVIFIGENDAGKTVILNAIELLASNRNLSESDRRKLPNGKIADNTTISGHFVIEDTDEVPDEYRSGNDNNELLVIKKSSTEVAQTFVSGKGYSDDRFDSFSGAQAQKELLREFGIAPGSNETLRREQRDELVATGQIAMVDKEIPIQNLNPIIGCLPRIERVASTAYRSAADMIQSTLQSVAKRVLKPDEPDAEMLRLLESLSQIKMRIETALNDEVKKFENVLSKNHSGFKKLTVVPSVDFARSVGTSSLMLDLGDGDQSLDQFGDGTKRRLWMGLLEWEQEIARSANASAIRLYDEPDVNLHYEAQRKLFSNITELTADEDKMIQCFVCTHSVTLVDRAPSSSICLINIDDNRCRKIRRIESDPEDKDVVDFFNEIGRSIGLSNTALLYERAFFLVEGESEEDAIPILYKRKFGRSMTEDGIVLINLQSCSAWKSVIRTLLKNREDMVHLLLDSDCQSEDSSAKVNPVSLAELGYGVEFISSQLTFIGGKEFEDAFPASIISDALSNEYPKEDGSNWEESEIQILLDTSDKFSDDLKALVRRRCQPQLRTDATKPFIAMNIAKYTPNEEIPEAIVSSFDSIRRRAGIA